MNEQEIINKYLHKVVKIKKPFFEEGYLEIGMLARVKAISLNEKDQFWEITFDLSEFHDHNIKCEVPDYFDKNHEPCLTASQAGFYPKNHIDKYYVCEPKESLVVLDEYLGTIEGELDTREKMLETLKMAYQNVLDDCRLDKNEQLLTKEQKYELGRRLFKYWEMKEL